MAISNPQFNSLLCSIDYHNHLIGVVIDEAHCIVQWGSEFRPVYAKLDKLRSFIPTHIPLYLMTATMTPDALSEVQQLLHICPTSLFYLNLGNDRKNIYQEVQIIRNAQDFAALDFLFCGINCIDEMEHAMIFVNCVEDAQLGWQRSHQLLPTHLQQYIGCLHSRRSEGSKATELEAFHNGTRRILWVTEIGGMVSE
jgi:superfamily II DNA helicase RecQ